MSKRTWLPELLRILRLLCKYIGNNDERIRRFLPPEHHGALDAVEVACAALVVILDDVITEGT